jgi:hypothetical protein
MPHSTRRLFWTALIVAWLYDLLFWEKPLGISFPIFAAAWLAAALFLAWKENRRAAPRALLLLLPAVYFAVMAAVRLEPMSLFFSAICALGALGLMANTWLGGGWLRYSFSDYLAAGVQVLAAAVVRPFELFARRSSAVTSLEAGRSGSRQPWRRSLPVVRGLLLALPVVVVFSALLASADQVFSQALGDFFRLFDLERLAEYVPRLVWILVLAFLLAGIWLHLLFHSRDERLIGLERPWLPSFLGFTESSIVLGSVDLLFAFFVAIQLRYFFGGQANISAAGFTYAEYARRGFGELVVVAFFSLLLFLTLSTISIRSTVVQRRAFSGMGLALVILLGVMLVSAFQRLLLYEAAYGFTRLRIYTHIFIIWLALLLLVLAVLELVRRPRAFALASLLAVFGFGATLTLINVDALIVRQNVQRIAFGSALDTAYLASLSPDALPILVELHGSGALPAPAEVEVGGFLACQLAFLDSQELPWQSFHFSRWSAQRSLAPYQPALEQYPTQLTQAGIWRVTINGSSQPCFPARAESGW